MKYVLMIIISLLFLTGCEDKIYEDTLEENITLINNEIDVYSDIYLKDIIELKNDLKLDSNNYKIDTSKLGIKEYDIYYTIDKKKYLKKIQINVVDKEEPKVFSGTNKTVYKNYTGELCDLITYGDNYDKELSCEINGEYDLKKKGTYKLKYLISDKSNNTKEVNVTLNVIEKNNSNSNNESSNILKKTEFVDVIKNYKNDTNEIGIDVSKWQGEIDFKKVKNAGATFVMMRIGVQKNALGELELDPYYEQNMIKAKEAGLKVGVYLYSIATSKNEAVEHAKWVIKKLDKEKLDLPVVFDWENWSKWNSYKMSFYDINDIANSFMNTIKDNGYEGMLYSSKFYLENIWTNKLEFPIWLAHYTEKTSYEGNYMMWQLCNNGRIDGINGDVDINILYNKE